MRRPATLYFRAVLLIALPAFQQAGTAATDAQKQVAIGRGLAYLHQTQQAGGYWTYGGYNHIVTGAASFAFLANEAAWGADAEEYRTAVDRAISYLLSEARVSQVSTRADGAAICPNGEASCKAIVWVDNGDAIYATGFVGPAVALYGWKAGPGAVASASGPLAGMTWAQIAQAITNGYAANQSPATDGVPGGAWRQTVPGRPESARWTTQPAVMSFLYDELLGAVTPDAVADSLKNWLATVHDASGAVCYQPARPEGCEPVNTGEWLLAMQFAGYDAADPGVARVLSALNASWKGSSAQPGRDAFGQPYAMWTLYSGLDSSIGLNDTAHLNNFRTDCGSAANNRPSGLPGTAACTWTEDFHEWLVARQQPDGSWAGSSYWTGPMATALDLAILGDVPIPARRPGCPLRQALWQIGRSRWPLQSLDIGGQNYGRAELLDILSAPVGSGEAADASLVLIDQLITAKLNVARGSGNSEISRAIAAADALVREFNGRAPYRVGPSSAIGQQMIEQANVLDRYNSGAMTPGCAGGGNPPAGISTREQSRPEMQALPAVSGDARAGAALASIENAQAAQAAANATKVRPFARKGVTSVALNSDGSSLATASTDNTIRIWTPLTGQPALVLPATIPFPTAIAFSPDGATLNGAARDSLVHTWSAVTGSELATSAGLESAVRTVAVSPDSRLLASGGEETRILLWDAASHKLNKILLGSTDFVNALAFSPDSTLLASGGEDARVLVFNVADGTVRFTLRGHSGPVDAVAFRPDGKELASAGQDSVVRVWDVAKGVQQFALAGHQAPVRAVAFSADGGLLASAGEDSRIIVWNSATGAISKTLTGSVGVINSLFFDPRGRFLVSATDTGEISIWNIPAGIRILTFTIPV